MPALAAEEPLSTAGAATEMVGSSPPPQNPPAGATNDLTFTPAEAAQKCLLSQSSCEQIRKPALAVLPARNLKTERTLESGSA